MDIEKLEQLARLRDAGALTPEEFNDAKAKLLSSSYSSPSTPAPTPAAATFGQNNEQIQMVSAIAAALHPSNRHPEVEIEEQEVSTFRSSTVGWLFGSFSGWIMLILCLAPLLVAANMPIEELRFACIAMTAIFVLLILMRWIQNLGSKYEITTQRFIIRRGIIFKSIDEIELFRVKDVRVDFSLLGQLMDIGQITARSSDSSGDLTIRDIPQARTVRETLRGLVARERQRRRVREVDEWYS